MSLIRGGNGLFPCPVCLVPKLSLGDYLPDYPERTGSEAQAILELAMAQRTVKDREEVLQQWSLRPIQVAFHLVMTNVALAYHTYSECLFGAWAL